MDNDELSVALLLARHKAETSSATPLVRRQCGPDDLIWNELGLAAAPSTLGPRAGRGLLTVIARRAGDVICTYTGAAVVMKDALRLSDKSYLMRLGLKRYVDARTFTEVLVKWCVCSVCWSFHLCVFTSILCLETCRLRRVIFFGMIVHSLCSCRLLRGTSTIVVMWLGTTLCSRSDLMNGSLGW